MINSRLRGAMIVGGLMAMLFVTPSESQACFCGLFGGRCSHCSTFAAPMAAPTYAPMGGCATCVPQTVQYLPQVSYRSFVHRVPVTVLRPASGCDPCSGCPVTTYRPITTWMQQTQLVPYTTYRIAYTSALAPCVSYQACDPCAGGCPGGACGATNGMTYAPMGSYVPSAGSCGCSPAPSNGTTYSGPAPAGNGAAPSTYSGSAPAGNGASPSMYGNPAPPTGALNTVPGTTSPAPTATPQPKTFQEGTTPAPQDLRMQPIPDPKADTTSAPKLIDPDARTTRLPIRQAANYQLISAPPSRLDDGGWRASRD